MYEIALLPIFTTLAHSSNHIEKDFQLSLTVSDGKALPVNEGEHKGVPRVAVQSPRGFRPLSRWPKPALAARQRRDGKD